MNRWLISLIKNLEVMWPQLVAALFVCCCCCQIFHINNKPICLSLWCHIVFPLSHFTWMDLTLTIPRGKKKKKHDDEPGSSIQLSQVEKAPERAWIKCLFSSCFDNSSADTSLRATTCPLVCPCISDITGHPILSLNY